MRRHERPLDYARRALRAGDERFQHIEVGLTRGYTGCEVCQRTWTAEDATGGEPCLPHVHTFGESCMLVGIPACDDCQPERLVPRAGDVAMCTRCGVWWAHRPAGVTPVMARSAAALAREPLPRDQIIAALDRAAEEMATI